MLAQFGLGESADRVPKKFSGGMRRRLDLAASMILAPDVLFLDEPTTGLDPAGRREVWEAIAGLTAGGTTVLLTTHYLDEADRLCDRISVVDHGRKVVDDTPDGLKRQMGAERLEVMVTTPEALAPITEMVRAVGTGEPFVESGSLTVSAFVHDPVNALVSVAAAIREQRLEVADLGLRKPTLDEAFLELVGRKAA